jgi:3-mercaptopyruvate sulfurtransferase SseA
MTKEIVKTEQDARAILESRGATDIEQVIGRCGCGETSALLGYNLHTDEIVGKIAICEECGDEWITK